MHVKKKYKKENHVPKLPEPILDHFTLQEIGIVIGKKNPSILDIRNFFLDNSDWRNKLKKIDIKKVEVFCEWHGIKIDKMTIPPYSDRSNVLYQRAIAIREMLNEGVKISEIATHFGITPNRIRQILDKKLEFYDITSLSLKCQRFINTRFGDVFELKKFIFSNKYWIESVPDPIQSELRDYLRSNKIFCWDNDQDIPISYRAKRVIKSILNRDSYDSSIVTLDDFRSALCNIENLNILLRRNYCGKKTFNEILEFQNKLNI